MYMKLRFYYSGFYGWKNGIKVRREGKKWTVIQFGKVVFTGKTLAECKVYIYGQYPDSFKF